MRERQNANSLGAVHTHTQILIQWKNLVIQRCYVNKADLLDSLEREQCLAKTGRVFCTQKLEKTGKTFNIKRVVSPVIKLGYLEMTQAF